MLVKAFLRWLVIIWADAEHTINAFEVAILQLFDNGSCIVAATAYEDGYLSAYCVNHQFLDFLFLFCGQCGCLACCCENAEKIGTVVQLIFHEAMKRLVVNLSVLCKWCNQGDAQAFEYIVYHKKQCFCAQNYIKFSGIYYILKNFSLILQH